jgi:hypothetical protein
MEAHLFFNQRTISRIMANAKAKAEKKDVAVRFYLTPELAAKFKQLAADDGVSQNSIANELIQGLIDDREGVTRINPEDVVKPGETFQSKAQAAQQLRNDVIEGKYDPEEIDEDEWNGHACEKCGFGMFDAAQDESRFPPVTIEKCSNCGHIQEYR